ncbi:MAG: hypothetical protein K1X71_03390 [Pirellulales bacterium]|nr:hypothetical protein [Pirellulales bacterium]
MTDLVTRLGAAVPTGASVTVSQIEAPRTSTNDYMVNNLLPEFAGKTITDKTGGGVVSEHANNVARNFYGADGLAPGVLAADIYNANDWYSSDVLRLESTAPPAIETRDVQNHSWIANYTDGSAPDVAAATDVLRRFDYMIERDNFVAAVGINNGASTTMPDVLGNAYNAIAVGRSDGQSSLGPSTIDVAGRTKPDIVAPAVNTSVATSWVSGAAALLLDSANGNSFARESETIKAVLLAGAEKSPFDLDGATASLADDWSHTTTQPLDLRYGAGQLNVDESHQILTAGQQPANGAAEVGGVGWDFANILPTGEREYFFSVDPEHVAFTFSAIATWNRQIEFEHGSGGDPATFTPSLANVDIRLFAADGFTRGAMLDESVSTIDNVEHIFQRALQSGHYVLTVATDQPVDFAVAWDADLVLKGDANGNGIVDGADYTIWADHFQQSPQPFWHGDFNGDGVVDGADYTLWADNFTPLPSAAALPIPEPAAGVLALVGCLVGWLLFRR